MYDLLIKGGKVIDPAQEIRDTMDVAISSGRIAALAPDLVQSEAKKVINAKGMIVTPGLIDMHVHVAKAILPLSVDPDDAGVRVGVTTVVDGGSTGHTNFTGFRELIIQRAQTEVLSFLHLCPIGQVVIPEVFWEHINTDAMLELIAENRDIIKGIKLRAGASVVKALGIEGVKLTKKVANEAGLPAVIHIGIGLEETISDDEMSAFTEEMLSLLEQGDILVHVYTPRKGRVIDSDDRILLALKEAMGRGVVLDVAHAQSMFSFQIAQIAMNKGILPTTLSTDVVNTNINGPAVCNLPVTMSKFLALGLSLDDVIAKTTINPARALHEEDRRGALRIGMPADVSILQVEEGDFVFFDGVAGNTLKGRQLLVPKLVLKSGMEIVPQPFFKNYTPGDKLRFPKGA